MGRDKISTTPLNTLMCGEIGRISRVGSFVELEVLLAKMMSSFDSCQVLLSPNFTYELSLEIQKYRLQCGRIYEISVRIYEIMGKIGQMSPTAYKCGRIFGHMRFEALGSRSFPIVDAYSSWTRIHLSRRRRRLYYLSRPSEAKNRHFSSCSKSSKFNKNSL